MSGDANPKCSLSRNKKFAADIFSLEFYQNECRYDIIVRGRGYSVDLTLSASFDRLSLSLSAFVSY